MITLLYWHEKEEGGLSVSFDTMYPLIPVPAGPWLSWQDAGHVVYLTRERQHAVIVSPWYDERITLRIAKQTGRPACEVHVVDADGRIAGGDVVVCPCNGCCTSMPYTVEKWTEQWVRYSAYLSETAAIACVRRLRHSYGRASIQRITVPPNRHVVAIFGPNQDLPGCRQIPEADVAYLASNASYLATTPVITPGLYLYAKTRPAESDQGQVSAHERLLRGIRITKNDQD